MTWNGNNHVVSRSQNRNPEFSSQLQVVHGTKKKHFLMCASRRSATVNPGIFEMQMWSVTGPRLSGGQVAHFIILLSCCPLLVWEPGPLGGCCVAMYNSCWNSCMSGWGRESERHTHWEVEGALSCVLYTIHLYCVFKLMCAWDTHCLLFTIRLKQCWKLNLAACLCLCFSVV